MSAPTASVIVPSYRSLGTIRACLGSLFRQDAPFPHEVIVVDSSRDALAGIVQHEFPAVRLLRLPERTEAPLARNAGEALAEGDMIAFLDSDCIAPPNWLRRLHAALLAGYDAVGGSIANGNGHSLVSWAGYLCEFREFLPGGPPREAANLTLGNAAYRRHVFRAAGRFPAGCFPQEDQVFHRRLCTLGARVRLDPSIVVAHFHRTTRDEFLEHQRRIGQANASVVRLLGLPGATLARRRRLAALAMPALVALRFVRTLVAGRRVARGLVLRRPRLAMLCWLGMWRWGRGFVEGALG